jgi:hypothetical protein
MEPSFATRKRAPCVFAYGMLRSLLPPLKVPADLHRNNQVIPHQRPASSWRRKLRITLMV